MILSGKALRPYLEEEIKEGLQKTPLSFYLYVDPSKEDCVAYLRSIKKLLDKFAIPYREGIYHPEWDFEKNLSTLREECRNSQVMLFRPLCKEEDKFIQAIPSLQDPDMLTDINRGKLASGDLDYLPATARSAMEILERYQISLEGKNAVVIGRSLSVGLPCFLYALKKNASVTLLHSKTPEEERHKRIQQADILFLASGKPDLVSPSDLHEGQVIIDCGYSSGSGDLGFIPSDDISYTPVPGGVGSLTSYCLLLNALTLEKKRHL